MFGENLLFDVFNVFVDLKLFDDLVQLWQLPDTIRNQLFTIQRPYHPQ